MEFILHNKRYDTDKAELIFTETVGRNQRDYYRTNKGTYFCHYVKVNKFELVSEELIKEKLMFDIEKYIEIFGDVAEG